MVVLVNLRLNFFSSIANSDCLGFFCLSYPPPYCMWGQNKRGSFPDKFVTIPVDVHIYYCPNNRNGHFTGK